MKRYYIVFTGRVQGVGFRYTAQMKATEYDLTGWVRNLDNGDVDMEVQGAPDAIHSLLRDLRLGERWIRIDDYSQKEIPLLRDEGQFTTKY